PAPASQTLRHAVISDMCADFNPMEFEETGCAVCGRLCKLVDLTPMAEMDVDWDLLTAKDVTRTERFSSADPVTELTGPVLAKECDHVCTECESKLVAGVTPRHSLANNLWIGELPWQLKDLTWAEKMMIAKVRHNRCVVRVASGRGKLVANAIIESLRKVYNILPLSRDELSEVLAFVFLGSAKPTDEDYVRTPMFVRRQRVKDALDWLKLNHKDYHELVRGLIHFFAIASIQP
ncbi:hypothetical protein B0H13DRAFT_1638104, partial [Mycena leptocephala]